MLRKIQCKYVPVVCVGLAGLLGHAGLIFGQAYTFTKIADTNGPLSNMTNIGLSDNGTVLFFATLDNGVLAVMTGSGGALTTVADDARMFSSIVEAQTINSRGAVGFSVRPSPGLPLGAIYVWRQHGGLQLIADQTSGFTMLAGVPFVTDNNIVTFVGFFGAEMTISRRKFGGGPIGTVVDTFGDFNDLGGAPDMNKFETLVFLAGFAEGGVNKRGIFLATKRGDLVKLVDTSGAFNGFSNHPAMNDEQVVVFHASEPARNGVFVVDAGGNVSTFVDDLGAYRNPTRPTINNRGTIAFISNLAGGGRGVFTGPDPVADKVVAVGDELTDGFIVGNVFGFLRGLNDFRPGSLCGRIR